MSTAPAYLALAPETRAAVDYAYANQKVAWAWPWNWDAATVDGYTFTRRRTGGIGWAIYYGSHHCGYYTEGI